MYVVAVRIQDASSQDTRNLHGKPLTVNKETQAAELAGRVTFADRKRTPSG
jgi:hypothetical protein